MASDDVDALARDLIDRFYDALAPDTAELAAFLGTGFQIVGSDGLRFDRETYLTFPKAITSYEISDLVVRRDGDVLTATFEVGYKGEFEGAERTVPRLARLAVFNETEGGWKLKALAALGTGENDVNGKAAEVVTRWLAANASGDLAAVRQLASPDFQLQRPDGGGFGLDDFLRHVRAASRRRSGRYQLQQYDDYALFALGRRQDGAPSDCFSADQWRMARRRRCPISAGRVAWHRSCHHLSAVAAGR